MEKSTIYSMNAQGLPVKEISNAINQKKSEEEIVKIIDVLEASHTDYLGRMSREGHVQKAPPRTNDKDGLQRPKRPKKGGSSDKGGNSTSARKKVRACKERSEATSNDVSRRRLLRGSCRCRLIRLF